MSAGTSKRSAQCSPRRNVSESLQQFIMVGAGRGRRQRKCPALLRPLGLWGAGDSFSVRGPQKCSDRGGGGRGKRVRVCKCSIQVRVVPPIRRGELVQGPARAGWDTDRVPGGTQLNQVGSRRSRKGSALLSLSRAARCKRVELSMNATQQAPSPLRERVGVRVKTLPTKLIYSIVTDWRIDTFWRCSYNRANCSGENHGVFRRSQLPDQGAQA